MEKEGLTEEMKAKAREQLREEKHWYRYERDRVSLFIMHYQFSTDVI